MLNGRKKQNQSILYDYIKNEQNKNKYRAKQGKKQHVNNAFASVEQPTKEQKRNKFEENENIPTLISFHTLYILIY